MTQILDPLEISNSTILIADDNAVEIQLICTILGKEGFNTICCRNGAQVISLAKEKLPDLILMDVMMPHFDGFEACRRLKNNLSTTNIPVIFLSAKAENKDKQKAFESGGIDYITKPFERLELLMRIRTHLSLKKAMDTLDSYNKWLEKMINDKVIDKDSALLLNKDC
jgi:DNA-binding response OmpR family regulator